MTGCLVSAAGVPLSGVHWPHGAAQPKAVAEEQEQCILPRRQSRKDMMSCCDMYAMFFGTKSDCWNVSLLVIIRRLNKRHVLSPNDVP